MAIFEAYIGPQVDFPINLDGSASQFDEVSSLRLIEDKKHIWALIFPIVWLLWNRLWFWLVAYILASIFIVLLTSAFFPIIGSIMSIVSGFFLFLEGSSLIAAKLERQGWQFAGVADAPDVEIAEYKFLSSNAFDNYGEGNKNLSIDSSAEPTISVDEKSNLSNQIQKPSTKSILKTNMDDRPTLGIFSEG